MYSAILFLHISAAFVTLGILAGALYGLYIRKGCRYRYFALWIGFIAAFQIFSGTVLAFLSPGLTAAYLTTHIAVYLGICAIVEALLFMRMQKVSIEFPFLLVGSPVLASVLLFVTAISYGV